MQWHAPHHHSTHHIIIPVFRVHDHEGHGDRAAPADDNSRLAPKSVADNASHEVEDGLAHAEEDEVSGGDSELLRHENEDLSLLLAVCLGLDPGRRRVGDASCRFVQALRVRLLVRAACALVRVHVQRACAQAAFEA